MATSPSGLDSREFRSLMGALPTGVAVLALRGEIGEPTGLTVNAVTSVSLEPPILLVCVHQRARVRDVLRPGTCFVLNVLSAEQADLSRRFASPIPERFAGVEHEVTDTGEVLILGAVAHIACAIRDIVEVGDHSVVYADVTGGRREPGQPLVFLRGQYTRPEADGPGTAG